jgi:chromosome segregation ATPase
MPTANSYPSENLADNFQIPSTEDFLKLIRTLEENNKLLTEQNQSLQKQNVQNNSEITALRATLQTLEAKVDQNAQKSVDNLKKFANEQINLIKNSLVPQISSLHNSALNREKQLKDDILQKFSSLEKKINQYGEQLKEQPDLPSLLEERDNKLNEDIQKLESKINSITEHTAQSNGMQILHEKVSILENKTNNYTAQLKSHFEQISVLEKQIKDHKEALEAHHKQYTELNKDIQQLESKVESTQNNNAQIDSDNGIQTLNAKVSTLENNANNYTAQLKSHFEQISVLEKQIKDHKEELEAHHKQYTELNKDIQTLESKGNLTQDDRLAEHNTKIDSDKIKTLNEKVSILENKTNNYTAQLKSHIDQISVLEKQIKDHKEELEAHHKQYTELNKDIQQLESKIESTQNNSTKIDSDKVNNLNERVLTLEKDTHNHEEKIGLLEERNKSQQKFNNHADFYKNTAGKKIDELDAQLNKLSTSVKSCEDLTKTVAHMKAQMDHLKSPSIVPTLPIALVNKETPHQSTPKSTQHESHSASASSPVEKNTSTIGDKISAWFFSTPSPVASETRPTEPSGVTVESAQLSDDNLGTTIQELT